MPWSIAAEANAIEKLGAMTTPRQMRHYMLTGAFLETSDRSRLMYCFRRLRPTIAFRADHRMDRMFVLAVLCLHPIGYYSGSYTGAMCPIDDFVAHLTMMRADEAYFWRKCNSHAPAWPEAGL